MNLSRITNPVVRAAASDLHDIYRRMEAIEGRALPSILSMKEASHEEDLEPETMPRFNAAGRPPETRSAAPIPPFNAIVAKAIETLRRPRTWL